MTLLRDAVLPPLTAAEFGGTVEYGVAQALRDGVSPFEIVSELLRVASEISNAIMGE